MYIGHSPHFSRDGIKKVKNKDIDIVWEIDIYSSR
jgi:hypothetical protein